jgi:hypothetical protein
MGVLQAALLPAVPARLGGLALSVAYRPAEGPGAGGDFYDVLDLGGERVAAVLGDVSGHGRDALGRSALMRYTLRAYLDAGLGPRAVLRVAGSALHNELGDDFATVAVAVHDAAQGTLTYASAGHPPPIVIGPGAAEPLIGCASPPVGVGVPTGIRQTTIPAPVGSVICFYTDGVTDARSGDVAVGRDGVAERLAGAGDSGTAGALIERLIRQGYAARDDMAVCLLRVTAGPDARAAHVEELDCSPEDVESDLPERFLRACGFSPDAAETALETVREANAKSGGGALLRVFLDGDAPWLELPAESSDAAAALPLRRRRAAQRRPHAPLPEEPQATGAER